MVPAKLLGHQVEYLPNRPGYEQAPWCFRILASQAQKESCSGCLPRSQSRENQVGTRKSVQGRSLQGRSLQGRLARAETSGPLGGAAATTTGTSSIPFCGLLSELQDYLCYVYLDVDIGEKY
jgi:hypothetical protein